METQHQLVTQFLKKYPTNPICLMSIESTTQTMKKEKK